MASYETNRSIHCEHRWQKVARRTTHVSAKRSNNTVNGALCTGNGYRVGDGDAKNNRALQHVREIGKWGLVDFIEVSGGDYEDPRAYILTVST